MKTKDKIERANDCVGRELEGRSEPAMIDNSRLTFRTTISQLRIVRFFIIFRLLSWTCFT